MTNTAQKRRKICKFLTMSRAETKQCSINSSFFHWLLRSARFFFLPLLVFFSVLSHRKPLPYHITLCLRKKSKTQNMGQIYISLLLRSVTKKMRFIHANKPKYVRKRREVPKWEEFQLHLLPSMSPFFVLGGEEKVLHGIPFRWSQEFPTERRNWKVKKMLRVTAADCCLWLRCFLSQC